MAIAVTMVLTPAIGGIPAAAVGNLASQGVGLATGIQDDFSFKRLGMTVLTAGMTRGVGDKLSVFGNAARGSLEASLNAAIGGAAVSAATQGIGVATGLQGKFSWAGVQRAQSTA